MNSSNPDGIDSNTPILTNSDINTLQEILAIKATFVVSANDKEHSSSAEESESSTENKAINLIIAEMSQYDMLKPIESHYYKTLRDSIDKDFVEAIHQALATNNQALSHYINLFSAQGQQFYKTFCMLISKHELYEAVCELENAFELLPVLLNLIQTKPQSVGREDLASIFTLCSAVLREAQAMNGKLNTAMKEAIYLNKQYIRFTKKLIKLMNDFGFDPRSVQADMHLNYFESHEDELKQKMKPLVVTAKPINSVKVDSKDAVVAAMEREQKKHLGNPATAAIPAAKKYNLSVNLQAPQQRRSSLRMPQAIQSVVMCSTASAANPSQGYPHTSWLTQAQQQQFFRVAQCSNLLRELNYTQSTVSPLGDVKAISKMLHTITMSPKKTIFFSPLFLNLPSALVDSASSGKDSESSPVRRSSA